MDKNIISIAGEEQDEALEENLNQLECFIQELDEFNRARMILYLDRNSYQEIGNILGISETNVATKISRIKKRLKQKFFTTKTHTQ